MSSRDDRSASGTEPSTSRDLSRRDALKLAAAAVTLPIAGLQARAPKRVIIAGGGIGGLCCGYELMKRGHDVVVLEASERTGGHVFTVREGLDDGLYADGGAEQFTQPGYERYWGYVREFNLSYAYYPRREQITRWIDGKMYTQEMLADPKVLAAFGLNQRELKFLKDHPFPELAGALLQAVLQRVSGRVSSLRRGARRARCDEHDGPVPPRRRVTRRVETHWRLGVGAPVGLARGDSQHARRRAVPAEGVPADRRQSDAARHLREASWRSRQAEVASDQDRARGHRVKVTAGAGGAATTYEGDYLVCAMSAFMLRNIPVEPAFPAGKVFALQNVPYYHDTRVIFQTRIAASGRKTISRRRWSSTSPSSITSGARARTSRRREDCWWARQRAPVRRRSAAAYRKLYPGNPRTSRRPTPWSGPRIRGRRPARRPRIRLGR